MVALNIVENILTPNCLHGEKRFRMRKALALMYRCVLFSSGNLQEN